MPLLTSPIDGKPMRQVVRHGVEIDVCETTGGVWLDKGELEKLMHIMKEEAANETVSHAAPQQQQYAQHAHGGGHQHPKGRKQESAFEKIMDLFEF